MFTGTFPADVSMTNVTVVVSSYGGFEVGGFVLAATPTTLTVGVYGYNAAGQMTDGVPFSLLALH